jgi:hypothetical protein
MYEIYSLPDETFGQTVYSLHVLYGKQGLKPMKPATLLVRLLRLEAMRWYSGGLREANSLSTRQEFPRLFETR